MTFRGDYQIQVIDTDGTQLDLLAMDRVEELSYSRVLNDYGEFSLMVDASDDSAAYFGRTDVLFVIWRRNSAHGDFEKEAAYFARFWNRFEDSDNNDEYVIFAGYSSEHLLARRVIVPDDDPVAAGGFVSRVGSGDQVMRDFVLYQCITPALNTNRAFAGLSAAAVAGTYNNTFQRRSYDVLLDVLKEIVQKTGVDFEVQHDSGASFIFRAGTVGADRSKTNNYPTGAYLVFDPRRGNLLRPSLTVDRKTEKTFAYVAGQGLEDERVVFPVLLPAAITASPWNRIEVLTDARNNEEGDVDGYLAAGLDALNDQKQRIDLEFTPDLNTPDALYNVDWFLGDRVTAQYANYSEDVRIQRVNVSVTDDETVTVEVANENLI